MGALIAAVGKNGCDVSSPVLSMLKSLSHRGSEGYTVASPQEIVTRSNWNELQDECPNSSVLLGQNLAKTLNEETTRSTLCRSTAFMFEGRLFPQSSQGIWEIVSDGLANIEEKATDFVRRFDGAFTFALCREKVIVGRDVVGACPLYFGESEEVYAVATERKALWRIGIGETDAFHPGMIALIDSKGLRFRRVRSIEQPPFRELTMDSAAQQLGQVLVRSIKKRISDIRRVAVAFSGGVDSVTAAMLTKQSNAEIDLVCVTLPKQREAVFAERAAKALDLPLHLATYTEEDVKETLPKVLWLIEKPDPVSASVAVPVFWAAEQSVKLGHHIMITGQAGDELFGGYTRYLKDYADYGVLGLQRSLLNDVASLHEANFQRDNKICAYHGLELRLPFADWEVIHFALSLHPSLKICSPTDPLRKRVLRRTAQQLGAPKSITEQPKKAIQFGTGVAQVMRMIARREHLSLGEYLERLFQKTVDLRGLEQ